MILIEDILIYSSPPHPQTFIALYPGFEQSISFCTAPQCILVPVQMAQPESPQAQVWASP